MMCEAELQQLLFIKALQSHRRLLAPLKNTFLFSTSPLVFLEYLRGRVVSALCNRELEALV